MTEVLPSSSNSEYTNEMRSAFRQFGTYANYGRALPDVVDGLKPIHRRTIWAMWGMKARHTHSRVKSARAVGEVTGKYHPHGTSAAYDTMVGMAQPFNRLLPLIDGQGNWGSLSFGAAAERYTECRLTTASGAMLGYLPSLGDNVPEVDEDTVDMEPNYSGEFMQPVVLPALWPHFLVNGTEGIGVGVSSRAPSHNLREVMSLAIHMVDSPNPKTTTILDKLPGPDLPCDCYIYDTDYEGIHSYITTGYGSFIMRAPYEVEPYTVGIGKKAQNGTKVIITGLPYKVAPEDVVSGVQGMVEGELLQSQVEVFNATSANGVRVVIDIKDLDVEDVLQRLFFYTKRSSLQQTFSVSMNAIVDGEIQTTSVPEALRHWIHHRKTVIRRRSQYRLNKAQNRLHIVDGFLRAIPIAHDIVDLVTNSANRSEASQSMQERWEFTENQATAILDMTIGQITRLGTERFEQEREKLACIIDTCNRLLTDHEALNSELKKEMRAVSKEFGDERRSHLQEGSATIERPDSPAVEAPVVNGFLALTGGGSLRWVQRDTIKRQLDNDYVVQIDPVTNLNRVEGITNFGWHVRTTMDNVPKSLVKAKSLFGQSLDPGEELVMVGSGAPYGVGTHIVLVTTNGNLKRIPWDSWAVHRSNRVYQVINGMEENEQVQHAFFLKPDTDFALVTGYGRILYISESDLAPKGDKTKGVSGIRLEDNDQVSDYVAWAGAVTKSDTIVYWTHQDQVGWFQMNEIDQLGRGGKGKTFTRSDYLISGIKVRSNNETTLNWYHGSMDQPRSLELASQSSGVGLSDRQLSLRAPGIHTASSIWASAT